jgi:hypothetical protein
MEVEERVTGSEGKLKIAPGRPLQRIRSAFPIHGWNLSECVFVNPRTYSERNCNSFVV